jgi:hypothetical protein
VIDDPRGPEIVVGQLQLEFDDIDPLTLEDRLRQWLNSQDEETAESLTAWLFIADQDSRRRRADRLCEVLKIQEPYRYDPAWYLSGGIEAIWLYTEAWRGYVNGAYFSALICAHAACERELAGCLFPYRDELDRRWLTWGLGKLVSASLERGIIDGNMSQELYKLNETRKVTAHFKVEHETPTSVQRRAMSLFATNNDSDFENTLDDVIRSDALSAIRVATLVLGSNLGFGGPSFMAQLLSEPRPPH